MWEFFDSLLLKLSADLGRWLGRSSIELVQSLLCVAVVMLVWGLWWHLILVKAQVKSQIYCLLMSALCIPITVAVVAEEVWHWSPSLVEFIGVFAGFCFYFSLIAIAVLPWPVANPPKPKAPKINRG